ncbi:MAG: NF038122 family metalloprotease [Blastocatellia bacterium]|nr:NF038122 family metalloprotease [Blastocatellia bacterium]
MKPSLSFRRYRTLLALAILAVSLLTSSSLPATQAQAPLKLKSEQPVQSTLLSRAVPETGVFVRYAVPGGTACREATPAEATLFSRRPDEKQLHVLNPERFDTRQSTGLKITLRGTAQLDTFPAAKQAFLKAAANWEARIATPLNVVIDVDFGPTRFGTPFPSGVLGSTNPQLVQGFPYADVRAGLIGTASSAAETSLYNSLPTTTVPTDIGASTQMLGPSMVFRAIGQLPATADPATEQSQLGSPPSIGFNSNFSFDFDPSNGIDGNKTDFDATATHEIGHALGFSSNVGLRDIIPSLPIALTTWDLFRFRPGGATLGTFQTATRVLSSGGEHRFFAGGAEFPLSTGRPNGTGGDGNQSSHWKADEQNNGIFIGIMDPTLADGVREEITANDLAALDTFGYRLQGGTGGDTVPPTVNTVVPQGGETFSSGSQMPISWKSTDNTSVVSHRIDLSRDGGQTFPTAVTTGLNGTAQSFTYTIPLGLETTSGRIRVTAQDGSFNQGTGTSAANFTIKAAGLPAPKSLTATVTGRTVALAWQKPGAAEDSLAVDGGLVEGQPVENWPTVQGTVTSVDAPFDQQTSQQDIAIEDGTNVSIIGFGTSANPNTGAILWANRLQPNGYPSRLTTATVLWFPSPTATNGVQNGQDFTMLVWKDPENDGPAANQTPDLRLNVKVAIQNGQRTLVNYTLPEPQLSITQGSYVIGLLDDKTGVPFPSTLSIPGLSQPAGSSSFLSDDKGKTFDNVIKAFAGTSLRPGSWVIRARVQNGGTTAAATGFNVYRSTTSPVAVTAANKIASVGANITTFTDETVAADTSYFYVVTATYENQTESDPSNEATVKIGGSTGGDTVSPTIRVLTPNGGETVGSGSQLNITWASSDNVGVSSHSVDLSTNGGTDFGTSVATGLAGSIQAFAFNVPTTLTTTTARIRVTARDAAGNSAQDTSDANFTIRSNDTTAPTVTVTAPGASTKKVKQGTSFTVTWNSTDNVGIATHRITLSKDGGRTFPTALASGIAGTAQSFAVTIPSEKIKQAQIKVIAVDAAGNAGEGVSTIFKVK